MPSITLADIQAAADKKYGPLVVELADGKAELVNPIRLSKAKRKQLAVINDDEDSEPDDKLAAVIKLAASASDAKRILAAVGDDLAKLKHLVDTWSESAQSGEASTSPS